MAVITNIGDLKKIHERRVPRMFYDYAESGSWTEQTFRENTTDFDQIRLRQRFIQEAGYGFGGKFVELFAVHVEIRLGDIAFGMFGRVVFIAARRNGAEFVAFGMYLEFACQHAAAFRRPDDCRSRAVAENGRAVKIVPVQADRGDIATDQ